MGRRAGRMFRENSRKGNRGLVRLTIFCRHWAKNDATLTGVGRLFSAGLRWTSALPTE